MDKGYKWDTIFSRSFKDKKAHDKALWCLNNTLLVIWGDVEMYNPNWTLNWILVSFLLALFDSKHDGIDGVHCYKADDLGLEIEFF